MAEDGKLLDYLKWVTADLHETRRRLREQASLLDQANDAIQVRQMDHTITYWNKASERLFGWTAEEAEWRRLRDGTARPRQRAARA